MDGCSKSINMHAVRYLTSQEKIALEKSDRRASVSQKHQSVRDVLKVDQLWVWLC